MKIIRAPETPLQLIEEARATLQAAKEAQERLAAALTESLRHRMHIGQIIDLNQRGLVRDSMHLACVKTFRGNDRGTRVFRIESLPTVQVDPTFLDLAKWTCEATPISEKSGKDMSGSSHGPNSRETVTLLGDLFLVPDHDQTAEEAHKAEIDRTVAFLNFQPTPESAPATARKAKP
ncbi:hypothetical protein ABIC83_003069 [Roseateles asaccharophilus]|uniref:hypothetical protein n=1 Tax=Roseateles asaccharophilus TaxID=582607 RepID=UPI003833FD5A